MEVAQKDVCFLCDNNCRERTHTVMDGYMYPPYTHTHTPAGHMSTHSAQMDSPVLANKLMVFCSVIDNK